MKNIVKLRQHPSAERSFMDFFAYGKSKVSFVLFLVSHDDEAKEKKRAELERKLTDGGYSIGTDNFVCYTGKGGKINFELELMEQVGCFEKIIGRVSPSAVWVKEGDVIEDEDFEIIYKSEVLDALLAIKCPTCKQYH